MLQADYACAIISVDKNHYLLEQRGADAQFAAGKLTCFGGRCEADESTQDCLLRELQEELSWQPQHLEKAHELWVGDRYVADFFKCKLDVEFNHLKFEKGRSGILVHESELETHPISEWHLAVLNSKKTKVVI